MYSSTFSSSSPFQTRARPRGDPSARGVGAGQGRARAAAAREAAGAAARGRRSRPAPARSRTPPLRTLPRPAAAPNPQASGGGGCAGPAGTAHRGSSRPTAGGEALLPLRPERRARPPGEERPGKRRVRKRPEERGRLRRRWGAVGAVAQSGKPQKRAKKAASKILSETPGRPR